MSYYFSLCKKKEANVITLATEANTKKIQPLSQKIRLSVNIGRWRSEGSDNCIRITVTHRVYGIVTEDVSKEAKESAEIRLHHLVTEKTKELWEKGFYVRQVEEKSHTGPSLGFGGCQKILEVSRYRKQQVT